MTAEKPAPKQRATGRPFQKGVSGNPRGKPVGTRSPVTQFVSHMRTGEEALIARKIIDEAISGDGKMLAIAQGLLWPAPKSRAIKIDLGNVSDAKTALIAMGRIIAAMSDGTITADEANALAGPLERYLKTIEFAELEERIAALERASCARP
jgi:hypothetical protein